jgi:hypothetical protein
MPSSSGDAEIGAIEQVIKALDPLDTDARTRVLDYAFKRLGIEGLDSSSGQQRPLESQTPDLRDPPPPLLATDIRSLKEEKQPKSANEMAAIVGYYLAEVAPESERKKEIGTAEIEKYFKQAQHRLPEAPGKTLPNATAAGYFDSAGRGLYSLNPVGHNLVAHGLPRASSSSPSPSPRKKRAKAKRKASEKAKAKAATKGKAKRKSKS